MHPRKLPEELAPDGGSFGSTADEVAETGPTRYRFNPDSDVSTALIKLEEAINAAGPIPKEASTS